MGYSKEVARKAEIALRYTIIHASIDDYGLDLSHPHIRLAQLYLGSSPCQPGTNDNPENTRRAQNTLDKVKVNDLAPRTKCIYHFTQSDLYKSTKETAKAIQCAQQALKIAKVNKFETEICSAKARLHALGQASCVPDH